MPVFGLIGNQLGHTFSKKYFTEKFFAEARTKFLYENFQMDDISGIKELVEATPDLMGLNITIPFKQDVLKYLDEYNSVVKETGACNCIVIKDKRFIGFNTDVFGFVESFKKKLLPHDKNALVLGTGGSSKAVCAGLTQLEINYKQVSRNPQSPQIISYHDLTDEIVDHHSVIINTTPIGSGTFKNHRLNFPFEKLTFKHYLYDLIYNPPLSGFLMEGNKMGSRIMNGEEMLRLQAEENWRIWTSEFPDL